MAQNYNNTLNLPKTDFAMRAELPKREPDFLKRFEQMDLYKNIMRRNDGKPLYVLHDGPPYANGDIHLGTALNKVLKDFIVRYKNMTGFQSPYVPGWDTHGLPIELKARKKAGLDSQQQISPVELRKICKEFALTYVEDQKAQFKRLGVVGEWDNPYLTYVPEFEARQIEIFGEMAHKGYIYKGLKPVYWCPECNTALAEAEIEYAEDPCYSIFVKFHLTDDKGVFSEKGIDTENISFVIWTTTTWTLPGNVALSVGPDYEYALVKSGDEYYVMAAELVESVMEAAAIEEYKIVGTFPGSQLEYMKARHPFLNRDSLVIVGDHVTLESGTGVVHTAPGHGVEDFEVCRNYKELPIIVPVDDKGFMTIEAGEAFAGLSTDEANKAIAKELGNTNHLFALKKIIHQYPHCWRCKSPILFRATEQWFCSVEAFKDDAVKAIQSVKWIPSWGEGRITNMVMDRSDWCISRQRIWGVPIPILYCVDCGKELINQDTIGLISDIFRREGSDAWYIEDASCFVPEGTACACGCNKFTKESDIMDVWFDSGVTHTAVLDERDYLHWPADCYLEGADQYRGWFQSSLLTAVATRGESPFKTVVTHGWVVDGEGRKMSKSLGNGILPPEIVDQYGADILRLWVASSDYHADIRISREILKQLSEVYRKIRNTARFILGCLGDFDPDMHCVADQDLEPIDRYALSRLNDVLKVVHKSYEAFEYHMIFHAIHNFCVVDMSNFYLDVLKDRLYVEKTDSVTRRAAQTAIYRILDALTLMIAPILAYTSDEIWQAMPHDRGRNAEHVLYNDMPDSVGIKVDDAFTTYWDSIHQVREDVKKALELSRENKEIGASLEAKLHIYTNDDALYKLLEQEKDLLSTLFIVSQVELNRGSGGTFTGEMENLSVSVSRADGVKCERCWTYSGSVGQHAEHPTLCSRCVEVLK